jgi:hypothetical protein
LERLGIQSSNRRKNKRKQGKVKTHSGRRNHTEKGIGYSCEKGRKSRQRSTRKSRKVETKTTTKAQEVSKDTRKKSPESTSSEPQKKAGNRKSIREVRIRVIRLRTAEGEEVTPPSEERKEVVLTPAPGYVEAEGQRVLTERGGNGTAEDQEEDEG